MKIKNLILIILTYFSAFFLYAFEMPLQNNISLITVSVTGAIKNPGVYKLPLDSRLSQAIEKANYTSKVSTPIILSENTKIEDKNQNDNISKENFYSLRHITIFRGKNKKIYDLKKFYQLGKISNNPYLKDGDIIYVPAALNFVYINGEINSPGRYELLQNEKLSDIIALAMGIKNSAFLDSVTIFRYKPDKTNFKRIVINYNKSNPKFNDITLNDGDRIFIRSIPNFQKEYKINIEGEIKFPGDYIIEKNKTTLFDILKMAGSPTKFADLKNALLIRLPKDTNFDEDSEFKRLKLIPISDMNNDEYEYFKARSRILNGIVDADFEKLWQTGDSKYNITLKDGDKIYIPDSRLTVEVLGQVKNPGKYPFIKGKDYFYYIQMANGFALRPNKKRIRIIKFKSGTWEKPKNSIIEPGDKIFVPEKPRYDYVKITKDLLQILTSAATLYFMRNSFK